MQGELYHQALRKKSIDPIIPDKTLQLQLEDLILNTLVAQQPIQENPDELAKKLHFTSCDGFILGCTELPAVFNEKNLGKPCINTLRVLAKAALCYATK